MVTEIAPLFVPMPGGPELVIILFIAILLFGANKIPKLARSTGEAMGEFQKGREKVETELEEMREMGTLETDDEFGTSTTGTDTTTTETATTETGGTGTGGAGGADTTTGDNANQPNQNVGDAGTGTDETDTGFERETETDTDRR